MKKSQNELLSTKSRLYANECKVENLQAEVRKTRRENKLLEEKVGHLERELQG